MSAQAFCLLTLPRCSLRSAVVQAEGELELQSVSVPPSPDNHLVGDTVCLVLKCGAQELPIEPSRTCVVSNGGQTFAFQPTQFDFATLVLDVHEGDTELLQSILEEYCDLHHQDIPAGDVKQTPNASQQSTAWSVPPPPTHPSHGGSIPTNQNRPDLAGRLVLINEDNGEVVGQVSDTTQIQEQSLGAHDPVVVEIDEDDTGNAMEVFVRAVPAQERDWISWGAIGVSKVITGGTTLLISGVSAAGNYYMKRSKSNTAEDSSSPGSAKSTPSPTPSRATTMLNSSKMKANLEMANKYSGKARVLSGKTVKLVDEMIARVIGNKSPAASSRLLSRRPPPPSVQQAGPTTTSTPPPYQEKPPLPPRSSSSPSPYLVSPQNDGLKPALPPRSASLAPQAGPSTSQQPPSTNRKARLMLSLNLILDTFDHNTKRLLEAGTTGMGTMVGHKYGKEAGDNTLLAAGAVKNVALVYVDVRGFTHRALLKRAGKHYIKAKVTGNKKPGSEPVPMVQSPTPMYGQPEAPK